MILFIFILGKYKFHWIKKELFAIDNAMLNVKGLDNDTVEKLGDSFYSSFPIN